MRLTLRDLRILETVSHCVWLSTSQIKRYYFENATTRAVNKRLKKLVDVKYLASYQPSRIEQCYFRLAQKGKHVLVEKMNISENEIYVPRKFPAQINHFSKINDLRWFYEQGIDKMRAEDKFFYTDRELKKDLSNSLIIPDVLLSFISLTKQNTRKRNIIALEYDSGSENPQYVGRDKIQKYVQEYHNDHKIYSHQNFKLTIFADNTKKTIQLIKHSKQFLNSNMTILFASLEDLYNQNNLFAPIYINPLKIDTKSKRFMCSLLD